MERFLYRLSKSRYAGKFILKGGLLFYVWSLPLRRPTKDMDFRGYVDNNPHAMKQIVRDLIAEPVAEDGITFDPKTVTAEQTQIDADYEGIRVKFLGQLGRSRISMQLDIGFSDEITSRAEPVEYPGLFPDQKKIRIKSYPKESVISEKFHAMVHHGELNSRWKDYYDIWLIFETFEFDSASLQKAIEKTFKKRETDIPSERPAALTAEFASANQIRWSSFLTKMNLENSEAGDFTDIVEGIWEFLEYPLRAASSQNKSGGRWTPGKGWK